MSQAGGCIAKSHASQWGWLLTLGGHRRLVANFAVSCRGGCQCHIVASIVTKVYLIK